MEMQGHDLDDDQPQEQVQVQAGEILEHDQIVPPEECFLQKMEQKSS
jgi:hypothetical protein